MADVIADVTPIGVVACKKRSSLSKTRGDGSVSINLSSSLWSVFAKV
jgi:hypothetical protein